MNPETLGILSFTNSKDNDDLDDLGLEKGRRKKTPQVLCRRFHQRRYAVFAPTSGVVGTQFQFLLLKIAKQGRK